MCDKWKNKLLRDKYYNDNMSYRYAFRLDRKGSDEQIMNQQKKYQLLLEKKEK